MGEKELPEASNDWDGLIQPVWLILSDSEAAPCMIGTCQQP